MKMTIELIEFAKYSYFEVFEMDDGIYDRKCQLNSNQYICFVLQNSVTAFYDLMLEAHC